MSSRRGIVRGCVAKAEGWLIEHDKKHAGERGADLAGEVRSAWPRRPTAYRNCATGVR